MSAYAALLLPRRLYSPAVKYQYLVITLAAATLITSCGGTTGPAPSHPTPSTPPATGGGTTSFNQQQTERLYGSWNFTFTIINTFSETYKLKTLNASTATPGDYYLAGTDQYNNLVLAGYDSKYKEFSLYDPGVTIDLFYTFDFTGTNTVRGCYYQVDLSTNEMSRCYPMTGNRYSMSASALGPTRTPSALRKQEAQGHTPKDSAAYRRYLEVKALASQQ
ncbi:hypothetical protein Dgeo_1262 [Deinococcus geothermalis DSM 11300]|uniref:Uncharacterized protein n=1 Tax=Deinococcus geothermalis (strain DSM 11300 / CIP 105573 / AG-3a) TaxID=319795 RepID=Q1IYX6_DEIGD|nr:hypothetical protein Dgeo_1262 [Deinococcus geothermalis DSM 11300]